jgi:hypothetical protein
MARWPDGASIRSKPIGLIHDRRLAARLGAGFA